MRAEIPNSLSFEEKVFGVHNEKDFASIALELYHFQYHNNPLYRSWSERIYRTPAEVNTVEGIPFLPIAFFKSHAVRTTAFEPQTVFQSSGTTGVISSRHEIKDLSIYEKSFRGGFRQFYGNPEDYCILGLLPSYLERGSSSLVYMVDRLILDSSHPQSGFYLNDLHRLAHTLDSLEAAGQKTLLIGVTYALLDFARTYPRSFQHTVIMETGGMKGRKEEMTRAALYTELSSRLGATSIHSEYGMTELLSQAYGIDGQMATPPWMKVLVRDETDPFSLKTSGTGALNVIDLANIYSCAFLATEDIASLKPDGTFEVLGRMDHSDVRGCSQLIN